MLQHTGAASLLSLTMLSCSVGTDKAGGKKFSKDFEEGSAQLQEFIKFYGNHCKTGAPLMQALGNADIFYEMQYKEVKIVANVSDTCICGQKAKPEILYGISVDYTTHSRWPSVAPYNYHMFLNSFVCSFLCCRLLMTSAL